MKNNPTPKNPVSPKVTWPTAMGFAVAIMVWILGEVGVDVPAEIATATTGLLVFIVGYFVADPNRTPPQ